jgi:hypothetical protein
MWSPRWNDIDRGKLKDSEKNLSQFHFVHHKSHWIDPGVILHNLPYSVIYLDNLERGNMRENVVTGSTVVMSLQFYGFRGKETKKTNKGDGQ